MNNKLEDLKQKIAAAKEAYYSSGTSPYSDYEYDLMVSQAEKLGYIETVGSAPVKEIPTITHEHPMLSLDKVHTVEELKDFIGNKDVVYMWKADGLTISATYVDGILTRLETRGNGEVGNDIMFHASSIENLPKVINKTGRYVIDGECVILYSDFEKIKGDYSNPRNLASGSLNQLDPKISATRHLRFYAWDVIEGGCSDSLFNNLQESVQLGFDAVCHFKTNDTEHIQDILDMFRDEAKENGFPIDGCVIKFDSITYGRTLGKTEHHLKNAMAFKYESEVGATRLKEVIWQSGKTGVLTPVAVFEPPIELSGTIVERASLHNVSIIKQLGMTNGCTCYVTKSGEIIPYVERVDYDGKGTIQIPQACPVCGAPTVVIKQNDSEVLYCTNDSCPGRFLGKLKTFVSKQGLDIDGLSEKTLEDLIRLHMVSCYEDIFNLFDHATRLKKVQGYGERSVNKLLESIEQSRRCDFPHFLTALSIPGIGAAQSKVIAKKFSTWAEFCAAIFDGYDFSNLEGIGKVLNGNIQTWFNENYEEINKLAEYMVFADAITAAQETGGGADLSGKTFVVTGAVYIFKNRDELKKKIESLGGKVAGSVSKKTDYLINNDSTSSSSKNLKAKELGIPIITEEEFVKLIE